MRRLYILSVIGIVLLATVLVGVAVFSPETINNILDPERIEVVNARWGNMVNRTYEPEDAIWINFTIFNYGKDKIELDVPTFKLAAYIGSDYSVIDTRRCTLQHGENEIMMMGRTFLSDYQLKVNGYVIWEGSL